MCLPLGSSFIEHSSGRARAPAIFVLCDLLHKQAIYVHEGCEVARAAVRDGLAHPSVQHLAVLGAGGRRPQRELRDFHRLHDRTWGPGLEPTIIKLKLLNHTIHGGIRDVAVPIIAPHELFHHLYANGNFERFMLGAGNTSLNEYWSAAMGCEWTQTHPLRNQPHMWPFAVPIVWFTDGAEFSKSSASEGVVWTWSSAMVAGVNSVDSKMLGAFLVGDQVVEETNDELIRFFAWSQEVMMRGSFPERDFYGQEYTSGWRQQMKNKSLAGPYIGAFCAVTHDAKARYETHKFVNYYLCKYICDQCFACSSGPLLYSDFNLSARWRSHRVSWEQYLAITPVRRRSPWCSMPGFVHSRALYDFMHCMHLGCGKDAAAQCAVDVCLYGYMGGGSLGEQLHRLWLQYRRWCKNNRVPYTRNRFSCRIMSIAENDVRYPKLHSRIKAAYTKSIIRFMATKAQQVRGKNPADEDADLRSVMMWGLADCMYVFDVGGQSLGMGNSVLDENRCIRGVLRLNGSVLGENRCIRSVLRLYGSVLDEHRCIRILTPNEQTRFCFREIVNMPRTRNTVFNIRECITPCIRNICLPLRCITRCAPDRRRDCSSSTRWPMLSALLGCPC